MSRVASAAAASNAGVPATSVSLLRTTTSADGGTPELGPQERLGARRLEVVEDEPAGAQLPAHPWREGQGDEEHDRPGGHDPPGPSHDEPAESIEGGHVGISPRFGVARGVGDMVPATPTLGVSPPTSSASIRACSSS